MRFAIVVLPFLLSMFGCASKPVCANGSESFRPVLDAEKSCKVRIRQVLVGSEINLPASIALDGGSVNWTYDWAPSEFKNGQVELGHFVLKPQRTVEDSGPK